MIYFLSASHLFRRKPKKAQQKRPHRWARLHRVTIHFIFPRFTLREQASRGRDLPEYLFPPEREQCCNGASQRELSWNQGIASESRQIITNGGAYGRGGKINPNNPFQFNKKRLSCLYLLTLCFMLAGTSLKESVFIWQHQYFETVFQARGCCWSAQSN